MQAVAELFDDETIVQEVGTVEAAEGALHVHTKSGRLRAELAMSCLVAPVSGDRVLVATTGSGRAFVLAVLVRPTDAPPRLRFEGDVDVAAGGRLRFVAKDGVDIATENDVNVVSRSLEVRSKVGRLMVDSAAFVTRYLRTDAEQVKTVVGLLDQVAERFSLTAKRAYRFVEEVDVTRAEQVDIRAEKNVAVRGQNAVVSADGLVKVDGRQIHLG